MIVHALERIAFEITDSVFLLYDTQGYVLDGSPVESNSYQIPPQMTQQQMHKQSQALSQQQQSQPPPQMMHPSQQQQRQTQYQYQQTSSPQRQSPVSPVDVPCSDSIVLNVSTEHNCMPMQE